MPDLILLNPVYEAGFGDDVDTSAPAGFNVHFIRLKTQGTADQLLAGIPLPDLPSDDVEVKGEVRAPDGSPPEPFSLGSPAIGNLDDALSVVAAALQNPSSVLGQNGFETDTPVFIWHKGRQAVRAIPPATDESE